MPAPGGLEGHGVRAESGPLGTTGIQCFRANPEGRKNGHFGLTPSGSENASSRRVAKAGKGSSPWDRAASIVAEQERRLARRELGELAETGRYLARDEGQRCPECDTPGVWRDNAVRAPCRSKKCKAASAAAGLPWREHTHVRGALVCPRCAVTDEQGSTGPRVISLSRTARVAYCGRETARGAVWLRAYAQLATGELRASFAGVRLCRNGWRCPHCARVLQARAAVEVHACTLGFRTAHRSGMVYLVTLTPRHRPDLLSPRLRRFEPMRRAVTAAYRSLLQGREVAAWRRRFHVLASCRALEATHGSNGWHPHIHALLFVSHRLSPDELSELRAWYARHWGDAVEAQGYERPLAAGVDIREADFKGRYLTKMGLRDVAAELARGSTKRARCSHCGDHEPIRFEDGRRRCSKCGHEVNRSPMQILADYHANGEVRDRRLWTQYYHGIHRALRLTWSRWKDSQGRAYRIREIYVPKQASLANDPPVHDLALDSRAFKRLSAKRRADALDAFETRDRIGLEVALGDATPAMSLPDLYAPDDPPLPPDELDAREGGTLTPDEWRELKLAGELPGKSRGFRTYGATLREHDPEPVITGPPEPPKTIVADSS